MSSSVERYLTDALADFALGRPMSRSVLTDLRDRGLLDELRIEDGWSWEMSERGKALLADAEA